MTTADHRIHGLADDEITPDWPPLEVAEVRDLLAGFAQLGGPSEILWRSSRPFSAAARVRTAHGEVFVKRHHTSVRTPATLAEEHAFIAHLRQRGLPIPAVLADTNGRTAIAHNHWTYEVHALAAGVDLYRDHLSWVPLPDTGQARTAGRALATLHRAASDYQAPQRDTWMLVSRDDLLRAPDPGAAIQASLPDRPALADYLQRRDWRHDLTPLWTRQRRLQPRIARLPRLWTHNDWHVSNLCWSDPGSNAAIRAILDFGLASPTFALYDLATAIERNAIAWLHLDQDREAIFPQTARALIAGYAEILPLDTARRQLLAELLPIVHIDFALSEVEYFHGATGSTEHADVAYDTFLLGHAAWFDTDPGRAMLAAISDAP